MQGRDRGSSDTEHPPPPCRRGDRADRDLSSSPHARLAVSLNFVARVARLVRVQELPRQIVDQLADLLEPENPPADQGVLSGRRERPLAKAPPATLRPRAIAWVVWCCSSAASTRAWANLCGI